ncbi:hypothetical protein [Paracoccus tegillarcae]|uniref:DUF304 domain-containing protein n=1 Tax=Paracoccus tegillarcae TaxID=1529068 RepID=A0A2K9EHX5_9RHOB|nr:hypothetical protein [Paracoccus tegillarcae]AUH34598.1 hypothetical protein CUV01_15490 [Paracoccus tegillarcae]
MARPVAGAGCALSETQMRALWEPEEKLIWQGWPDSHAAPRHESGFWLLFGSIWVAVGAVFTMVGYSVTASEPGMGMIFLALGIVLLCGGVGAITLPLILYRRRSRATHSLLTNRRAIVMDPELRSFPITPSMKVDDQPAKGRRAGSVFFGTVSTSYTNNEKPVIRPVGFTRITEAPEVVQAIRALQEKMRKMPEAAHV